MKRLQEKYGTNERQVDMILRDLKFLRRVPDGDSKALYKMIETVENCWLDLQRMNLEAEMDTTSMLSTIEKLLPDLQKGEWTLQKQKNPKETTARIYCFWMFFKNITNSENCSTAEISDEMVFI